MVGRAGGTFRIHRQVFGAQASALIAVSEYKDWNGLANLRSDPEFSQLVERIRSGQNPAADLVGADLYEGSRLKRRLPAVAARRDRNFKADARFFRGPVRLIPNFFARKYSWATSWMSRLRPAGDEKP